MSVRSSVLLAAALRRGEVPEKPTLSAHLHESLARKDFS